MDEDKIESGDMVNSDVPEYDAAIQFTINKNGQVYVFFALKNESIELENTLAKFFYDLSTGAYTGDIISILDVYSKQTPENQQFIRNAINKWGAISNIISSENSMDELCVKPEEFLAVGGFSGGRN